MKLIHTLKWFGLFVLAFTLLIKPAQAQAASQLADGTYTADYLVLKAEDDSVSMANDYWEKPATVTMSGGKANIRLTINHSAWVTEFKVPSGGGYADTRVVSSSKSKDTRLVEFGSDDISKPIVSKIHVTVEEIDYDHDYTIRIVFQEDSFKLIKGANAAVAPAKTAAEATATASAAPNAVSTAVPTSPPVKNEEPSVTTKPSGSKEPPASASAEPGQTAAASSVPSATAASSVPSATAAAQTSQSEGSKADFPKSGEGNDHGGEDGPALAGGADTPSEGQASSEEEVNESVVESGLLSGNGEERSLTAAPLDKEKAASDYAPLLWILSAAILLAAFGILYFKRMKKRQAE
ncbi:heme uptake protein IsdC [Paenibacillus oryzae]|uniref:Heme uptake protein IsdC n=1 Tax=Paenibacillus oryzae TaxID=1844972 RepID=A0A1A5YSD5_9BACL|nr:heme uptake protein IsdC [Paenibacillus oryzae]OBR68330.1 heme uptake protein IsdC [Paenibacillus oryzae]